MATCCRRRRVDTTHQVATPVANSALVGLISSVNEYQACDPC